VGVGVREGGRKREGVNIICGIYNKLQGIFLHYCDVMKYM
jgi:hypothetical protein